jgi:hypothetical protein
VTEQQTHQAFNQRLPDFQNACLIFNLCAELKNCVCERASGAHRRKKLQKRLAKKDL